MEAVEPVRFGSDGAVFKSGLTTNMCYFLKLPTCGSVYKNYLNIPMEQLVHNLACVINHTYSVVQMNSSQSYLVLHRNLTMDS